MAVRFVCPSCQQPLEIDEQYAGQSVACPYCNRVVTAPAASTWPLNEHVPVASPATNVSEAPSSATRPEVLPQSHSASVISAWATALTLAGVGFIFVAVASWSQIAYPVLVEKTGPPPAQGASRDDIIAYEHKAIDVLQSGVVPVPGIMVVAFSIGLICSLIGFVLGIKMVVQGQRRGRGILISLLALFCIMCQGLWTLSVLSLSLRNHLIK